jgi:aminopeptidase
VDRLERLAELAVVFGANVQPGQVVGVGCEVGHLVTARAIAAAAYRHGARFVDISLEDPALTRSRVLHADEQALAYAPAWPEARIRELDSEHGANIKITGPTAPGLFDDLDAARVATALGPRSRVWREVEYRVNSTIVPGPNEAWATHLRPELEPADALQALWDDIVFVCRLDAADPIAAWRERFGELARRAAALSRLALDGLRFRGPGTDLFVGIPAGVRWEHAGNINRRGIEHAWNVPSEEVYTVPDRSRTRGHVRLTRPAIVGGRTVAGVSLAFEAGRVVAISGGAGIAALQTYVDRDEGAGRLGEVALVDRSSRIGARGRAFGVILLDENAASHIALGFGFPELADAGARPLVNDSGDHLDVMVGSDEVEVTGVDQTVHEWPLLRDGAWVLPD